MRFGCCTNMVANYRNGTGIEHLDTLKRVGFDYVELPLAQLMELSEEEFYFIKQKILSSGIKCEACNNFFSSNIKLTGNKVNQEEIEKYISSAIDRAVQLDVNVIVFGSSGARNVPVGFPLEKARDQIISVLRYISKVVEQQGITIVIEHLNREESNIINTVSEALKLSKEVDRPNVKLLVDYYHLRKEMDEPEVLIGMGKDIRHIHFAKPEGRRFPGIADSKDFEEFFKYIKNEQYGSRVSIEAYSKNLLYDAQNSLELLQLLSNL